MFDYKYDEETGGILLIDQSVNMSKEPRPVYATELDFLGIDRYYRYESQTDIPYLWAESQRYYYRGKHIFDTKGGSLYSMPEVEIVTESDENGTEKPTVELQTELIPIDIEKMCCKNHELLEILEQITIKKVYATYRKYKKKVDRFHIAFSGGKDSIVVLDVCRKALPESSYVVIFGDTQMEFPDTYHVIEKVEKECLDNNIEFYRATSHLKPEESWKLFGPPSRVLRWCCTVHKSTPQTLKLREITGKNNYIGLDFVGVRRYESVMRSKYEEENYGKKQKGQYSYNPILEWTSAEVWLYIYAQNLVINEAYKKGNSRAGCLLCPMSRGKADSFRYRCYSDEIDKLTNLIKETVDDDNIDTYITNGGWVERKNGRDLFNNPSCYIENEKDDFLVITVTNPKTDWKEWIKTLGGVSFDYSVKQKENGYIVTAPLQANKQEIKLFKQVFHKSAYCEQCRACEVNCKNGCISFEKGLHIQNCVHCMECHNIDGGCLLYHSRVQPVYGGKSMKKKRSVNSFSDHAPKLEWVENFFDLGNNFFENHTLGPMQIQKFRVFLRDSGLALKNETTELYQLLRKLGTDSEVTWAIILINLVYNNIEIRWFIDNMPINKRFEHKELENLIMQYDITQKDASSIRNTFKRFVDLPMGTALHFGSYKEYDKNTEYLQRDKCSVYNSLVLLYALYRYAEENGTWSFPMSLLLDLTKKSAGISPVRIFGFDEDDLEPMLRGLSAKYEDFINVTFTHDLDKISLREYHTSADVLKLLEEE